MVVVVVVVVFCFLLFLFPLTFFPRICFLIPRPRPIKFDESADIDESANVDGSTAALARAGVACSSISYATSSNSSPSTAEKDEESSSGEVKLKRLEES